MGRLFNALLVLFASIVGYVVISRILEDTREFR